MRALLILSLAAPALFGQFHTYYHPWSHNNITVGGGVGRPRGDLSTALGDTGGLWIGYGYRFARNFQADIGLDTLFGAAGVHQFVETGIGFERIRDRQYFVPFGGRAVIPLGSERVLLSGGGGGAYMRYSESIRQPSSFFNVACPVCTSRSGWGYYGLVDLTAGLDRASHFHVGVALKTYRGFTEGEPLGGVPGVRTNDHWLFLQGLFGFSF